MFGFYLLFQIVICHPIASNNSSNIVFPVLLLYRETPGVVLEEKQPYIAEFPPGIINLKQINIKTIK